MGVHVNAATYGFIPWGEVADEERASLSDLERERLARLQRYYDQGQAYFQIQATRPQTIGYALHDSPGRPAGVDRRQGPGVDHPRDEPWESAIDRDRLLTERDDLLAHRHGRVIGAHLLREHARLLGRRRRGMTSDTGDGEAITGWEAAAVPPTPVGVAAFAEDVAIRRYGEQTYNIVHWSDFDRGGHFAAMEAPGSARRATCGSSSEPLR